MEPDWSKMVSEVISEFTADANEADRMVAVLKQTSEYGMTHSLWCNGLTIKEAKRMLRQLLTEMGVKKVKVYHGNSV